MVLSFYPSGYYGWKGIVEFLKEKKKKRSGCGRESNLWPHCGLPTPRLSKIIEWNTSSTNGEL